MVIIVAFIIFHETLTMKSHTNEHKLRVGAFGAPVLKAADSVGDADTSLGNDLEFKEKFSY